MVLGKKRGTKGEPGAPKRTMKVLRAVLRGAWLLGDEWLYASVEAGELLPEERYETSAFAGARLARQLREAGKPIAPLAGVALAVVDKDTEADERLRTLAAMTGATLTSATRAVVCVGGKGADAGGFSSRRRGAATPVTAEWLYDTVQNLEAMPYEPYLV